MCQHHLYRDSTAQHRDRKKLTHQMWLGRLFCLSDSTTSFFHLWKPSKKNSGYNEFGTKGGKVSDLNHYFNQLYNSKKGGGAKEKEAYIQLSINIKIV